MHRRFNLVASSLALLLACSTDKVTAPSEKPSLAIFGAPNNTAAGGEGQSGVVGSTLPKPLIVQVTGLSAGGSVNGQTLNFVVTSGGGSVFASAVMTGTPATGPAAGISGIGEDTWTLGPMAGPQTVEARLVDPKTGATMTQAVFHATATSGPAAVMKVAAGNGRTAVAGSPTDTAPAVLVTDKFGNPIPNVAVAFQVTEGGGSVANQSQTTGTNGIAAAGTWTLGTQAGPNTMTATSAGLSGSPVTFTATGINSGAMQLIPATPSTVFSGTVASTIPAATGPAVRVVDKNNNGVPNVAVTFSITAPSCPSCTPWPGTSPSAPSKIAGTSTITTLTDANGRASGGDWTLSTLAGANTLQATAVGLAGSPVIFTATGTAGAAALLFKKGGDGQSGTVGTAVTTPPAVQVTDVYGNPASSGIGVTFVVQSGGGSVSSGSVSGASSVTVPTDVNGSASASWTLGSLAGANSLTAAALGRTVSFTASATGPAGLNITNFRGDGQSQMAGTTLQIAPAVQVTDQSGHPVAGVQVVFSVTAGGGSITGPTQVTDASGIATVGSWTLGAALGTNELQAMFTTGVSSGYTIFVATATGPIVTSLADDGSPGTLRSVLAAAPTGSTILFADNLCPVGGSCAIVLTGSQLGKTGSQELLIGTSVTIQGPVAYQLTLDGRNELLNGYVDPRVLHISSGTTVQIANLTVSNGNGGRLGGGGILNEGTLTITNSAVSRNGLTLGGVFAGGILNFGTLTLVNSTVSGNYGSQRGGGIYNYAGTVTLTNSTVSGNTAGEYAGIENQGTLTLTNSTVSGNAAAADGGGIENTGTASLTNSMVNGNTAGRGGGISNDGGTLTLASTTVTGNTVTLSGSGIRNSASLSLTQNSSVCGNTPLPNIANNGGSVTGTNNCADP